MSARFTGRGEVNYINKGLRDRSSCVRRGSCDLPVRGNVGVSSAGAAK